MMLLPSLVETTTKSGTMRIPSRASPPVRRGSTPPSWTSTSRRNRLWLKWNGRHIFVRVRSRKSVQIDAEVGKARHMRVARCRHCRSRRYPAPISTTPHPHPNPWPIPSHVKHGPWLWLGNRWKSWGAKALSPISESCEARPTSCSQLSENFKDAEFSNRWLSGVNLCFMCLCTIDECEVVWNIQCIFVNYIVLSCNYGCLLL